jgi:hypothetical protein
MIDSEAKLWHTVKKLSSSAVHWQRIETGGTGRGIPDINGCRYGVDRWVELKFIKAGFKIGLSAEQCGWHLKRAAAGGTTGVLVYKKSEDRLYIANGRYAKAIIDHGLKAADPIWWYYDIDDFFSLESYIFGAM